MLREKRLGQAAITTLDVALYTTPDKTVTMLKDMDIANTTAGALTVRVHIIPDTLVVGTDNAIYYGYSIAANAVLQWRGTQVLEAGDVISVRGSATGLTITASGIERALS